MNATDTPGSIPEPGKPFHIETRIGPSSYGGGYVRCLWVGPNNNQHNESAQAVMEEMMRLLAAERRRAEALEKKLEQERTYANDLDGCLQSIAMEVTGSPETAGLVCKIEELVKSRAAAESERDKWHKLCQDQCEVETAIRKMLDPIIGRDLAFGTTDGQEPLEDAVRAALAKIGGKQ